MVAGFNSLDFDFKKYKILSQWDGVPFIAFRG
jgi:hypothetical protein